MRIVVASGKGGTGKTSVTAAFAQLASQGPLAGRVVLADADVDAANLGLVLKPRLLEAAAFRGGQVALIDQDRCSGCGACEAVCRFDAIITVDGQYRVDPIACDGCAACVYQCPTEGIAMQEQVVGNCFVSDSRDGPLDHADLFPGQENSGKLVTQVKQRARARTLDEGRPLQLVDGPPGIGCPVIAAVSGADLALIVTEPTAAGLHDLRRTLDTVRHFGVPALVCINKADLYPAGAQAIATCGREAGITVLGTIPFDATVTAAMVAGEAVTAFRPDSPAAVAIAALWARVVSALGIAQAMAAGPAVIETSIRNYEMRIAITAETNDGLDSQVAQHFGHAPFFMLVDIENGAVSATHGIANPFAENHQPGQIPAFIGQQQGDVMLSGGMGGRAIEFFAQAGIKTATGARGTVRQALESYLGGALTAAAPCDESAAHGHG